MPGRCDSSGSTQRSLRAQRVAEWGIGERLMGRCGVFVTLFLCGPPCSLCPLWLTG